MTTLALPLTDEERAEPAATERQRRRVQVEIDGRRTARERNRLGQFATPYALAVDIAREVSHLLGPDAPPVRFGEPSIGTGAFYSALRDVLGADRVASAVGVEIDPAFAAAARELWGGDGLQVIAGDFTAADVRARAVPRPNLILANPPYVRHHHLNTGQKERLRAPAEAAAGVPVSGLAGLYVYFVLLAHDWLEDGGLAAWLIPSEFMDVNYGAALKAYLTERVTLLRLHRFDPAAVQFDDALVSSAVVIFRKAPPPPGWSARFTFGGDSLARPALAQEVPAADLRAAHKWSGYPRRADAVPTPAGTVGGRNGGHTADAPPTLGDLFRVRRGIATGANEFFVMGRAEARARALPDEFLRPILPSPRCLRGATVIERGDDGHPNLPDTQVVIDCPLAEAEVRERHPALWAYLEEGRGQGLLDRYLISKRNPWYRQEQRDPAPFLSTYMGRGGANSDHPFRFLLNRSEATAPNVYLMLYPTGPLAALLRRQPDADAEVLALLGEITADELKGEGRVYGGGLHKIEPKELARLPAVALVRRFSELAQPQARLF